MLTALTSILLQNNASQIDLNEIISALRVQTLQLVDLLVDNEDVRQIVDCKCNIYPKVYFHKKQHQIDS